MSTHGRRLIGINILNYDSTSSSDENSPPPAPMSMRQQCLAQHVTRFSQFRDVHVAPAVSISSDSDSVYEEAKKEPEPDEHVDSDNEQPETPDLVEENPPTVEDVDDVVEDISTIIDDTFTVEDEVIPSPPRPHATVAGRRMSLPMVAAIPLPESPPPVCDCMRVHGSLDRILREANLSEDGQEQLRVMSEWPFPVLRDHMLDFGLVEFGEQLCRLTLLTRMCTLMEETELSILGNVQAVAEAARSPATATVPDPQEEEQQQENPNPAEVFLEPTPPKKTDPWLGVCVICMENEREYAIIPCGHISCCSQCGDSDLLHTCPMCRHPIEDVLKVILP